MEFDSHIAERMHGMQPPIRIFIGLVINPRPALKISLFSSYQVAVISSMVGMNGEGNEKPLAQTTDKLHKDHLETFNRFFIKGESHPLAIITVRSAE